MMEHRRAANRLGLALRRRRFLGGAAALVSSLTLAAATARRVQAKTAGGSLIWGMPAETDILDPHATGGWLTYDVTYQMFEGLLKEDLTKADLDYPPLVPCLAESHEISNDGAVYTFKLRPGVKFHDGSGFDAAAAKFNFDRFWNESSPHFYPKAKAFVAAYAKWIREVEVLGPMAIRIGLNHPNYEWIRSGLQSYGQPLMVSPVAVQKYGNEGIALHPVGTGPFRFVGRQQGVKTELVRNESYWGAPAKLDRIVFRPLEDPASRTDALRTGEVNMISTPVWDDIQGLVRDGFQLSTNRNVPDLFFLYLNMKNPYMQDVRVRRAINMAIDREGIARDVYRNTGRPEYGMLSPGTWAYDTKFRIYDYDPVLAKKLLSEVGHADGFKVQYDTFQYGTGQLVESWIQRDLKKIGIDAQISKSEWITYMHNWAKGYGKEVGISQMGWGMTVPAWTGIVTRSDSEPPNGLNSGWYDNPKLDRIFDQALAEPDLAKSAALYRQANRLIMDDAAYVPVVDDMQPILLAPNVKGFVNPPEDWFDLSTV